jgi:uncharacterized protein YjiS (DUF1127 family)
MAQMVNNPLITQHIAPMEWHKKIYTEIKIWHRNAVTRKQLRDLPEHLLADIGVDSTTAMKEANRSPFKGALFFWV